MAYHFITNAGRKLPGDYKPQGIANGDLRDGTTPPEPIASWLAGIRNAMRITLPLPGKACSPNARCHWAVKAKAVKAMRHAACIEAQAFAKPFQHPTIHVVAYHTTKRRHDRDNFIGCLKGGVDGLVDAGLFADDDLVRWGEVEFGVDKDNPRVVLLIVETTTNKDITGE